LTYCAMRVVEGQAAAGATVKGYVRWRLHPEMVAAARARIEELITPAVMALLDDPDVVIVAYPRRARAQECIISRRHPCPARMIEFWSIRPVLITVGFAQDSGPALRQRLAVRLNGGGAEQYGF
jgi:hypothetical protein